jgi:hypothetical protein
MIDETEEYRRAKVQDINAQVESSDKDAERKRLEAQHGQVWDSDQIRQEFEVIGFAAPFMVVKRKSDGKKGSLEFQHSPRFYFNFSLA